MEGKSMANLFISTRTKKGDRFGTEPGPVRYLFVPERAREPLPKHQVTKSEWRKSAVTESTVEMVDGLPCGATLFFVHGYNNDPEVVQERHNLLRQQLGKVGYKGSVISFDWPSADSALNYLEDRSDAKMSALHLVSGGIQLFTDLLQQDCRINVNLLAHSTGAYVVREAFDDADDRASIANVNWTVSQVCLIAADVSAGSFESGHAKTSSLNRHSVRITNYSNPFDSVLKLSNAKRIGLSPRLGRVGLPGDAWSKCVDVNCGAHWSSLEESDNRAPGTFSHSWHFGDELFARDLHLTLNGDIDRHSIPTRHVGIDGALHLGAGVLPTAPLVPAQPQ
jgi:esterase/lipase superfamily enzyme